MLITNHVLSGAVVGLLSRSPAAALGAGVVSHVVLDAVPHVGVRQEHFLRLAVPDGLVGLAAIGVVAAAAPSGSRTRVLAGVVGACLPDLDKPGELFFGRSPFPARVDAWHGAIQRESPRRWWVEVVAAAVSVSVFRRLRG